MKTKALLLVQILFWLTTSGSAEPIRIGVLTDLSGSMSFWGAGSREGAQLAQQEIRSSGGELELVFGDHQLQPKTAVTELQKLMEVDNISALYAEFTPTISAIAPIVGRKKMLMVYSAASVSPLQICDSCFKSYINYTEGCSLIGKHWLSQGIKRPGILHPNVEFGELCMQGMRQVFPDAPDFIYNSGDDVAPQVHQLKRTGADAIINVTYEPDFLRMMRALRALKFQVPIASQEDAISEEALLEEQKLGSDISAFAFSKPSREFEDLLHLQVDSSISLAAAALAYTHVKQLYRVLAHCKKDDLDCQKATLSKSPKEALTGFQGWKGRIADFTLETRTLSSPIKVDNSKTFRIGVTVPLTGDFASYGQQIRRGAEFAKDELAKQGINIELIVENACLPNEAISSINRLYSAEHIQGLENFCNIAVPAMAPTIQKNQIPTFAVGGVSDNVLDLGGYIFTTDIKVRTEARKIAEYAANTLKAKTVSILYILTQFGEDYQKHFTKRFEELGGKVVSIDPSAIGVNDFRAELLNIRRKNPDMIFAVHLGSTLGVLLKQAHDAGLKQRFMGSYEAGDPSVISLAKENANGIRFFLPMPAEKSPLMKEFESKVRAKLNSEPGLLESAAYDATVLLGQSLKECDGKGSCVKDALTKRRTYDGVSGHFSLDSTEESQRQYTLQEIVGEKVVNVSQ